jgi:hypothetical protein
MKVNPFLFGGVVDAEHFCPRSRLQRRLASSLRSGQNVALMGPRRVGKTSLIHHTARSIRGATLVYVDLWGVHTTDDLIRRCVQALDAVADQATLLQRITRALPGLTVTLAVDPMTGNPTLSPTLSARNPAPPETVSQIARLWASLAGPKRRLIVALDEFQDLALMDHADQTLGLLRREIQTMKEISFCFSGSVRNEMWRLFATDGAPFYKSSAILEVASDDFDNWTGFLRDRFAAGGIRTEAGLLDEIIGMADGNPGDTQQLCAAAWDAAQAAPGRRVTADLLRQALLQVFADERKGYEQIVADISGQQLAVLRAIAQLGGGSVQSAEFLHTAGITHASSAKAAAARLVSRRILQETPSGLRFSNPFFRNWLLHVRY